MVATVTQLKSSAQAVSYYEKDGYYAKDDPEHRDASFWHGAAARDAGLRGHVLPDEFEDVLAGWVPGTETRLGRLREGEHDHRPGWDITFSAPKSVSLEGLVIGDRRVIRAHDDAVRATLEWIETDLLQTRGWDPVTRQRPRVAADGMIVAGFRHLASRGGDPQLHTHCVLANMTRNASGDWRSVEPTMIRRSEKLIGAYYRNELARRLQSLGMAVTPTLIGRVPGFELAGYEKSFLDAFSGRRADILAFLEKEGLTYNAQERPDGGAQDAAGQEEIGLSQLVPQWRARARELGLARDKAALRPARPVDPATGMQVPPIEVPPPDLPENELRSLRRAPKLPPLPRDPGLAELGKTHAPPGETAAELSPAPETGVLEAVARAVDHVSERRTWVPEAEIRAVALGHAPGRYTLGEVDAAIGRLVSAGALIEVERRGMDRAFVTERAVKAEKKILAFMRDGRGKGKALVRPEAVEERLAESRLTRGQKEAVRTVLLSDDIVVGVQGHAGSGKTTMLREAGELLGGRPIHGLAPSAAAARVLGREAGHPVDHPAMVPHPLPGPDIRRGAGRGAGGLPGRGAGGGRVLDDRHRTDAGALADRRRSRGGAHRPGGRHGAAARGRRGPAVPSAAEGGDEDRHHGRGAAPGGPGAARGGDAGAPRRAGGIDPRAPRRPGARGSPRRARRGGRAVLARADARRTRRHRGDGADARDPPPGQRGDPRGAGGGGHAARPGPRDRPAGQPPPHPGARRRHRELRAGRHGGVPPGRLRLRGERRLHGDGEAGRTGDPRPHGRGRTELPPGGQREELSRAVRHRADRAAGGRPDPLDPQQQGAADPLGAGAAARPGQRRRGGDRRDRPQAGEVPRRRPGVRPLALRSAAAPSRPCLLHHGARRAGQDGDGRDRHPRCRRRDRPGDVPCRDQPGAARVPAADRRPRRADRAAGGARRQRRRRAGGARHRPRIGVRDRPRIVVRSPRRTLRCSRPSTATGGRWRDGRRRPTRLPSSFRATAR